jgi:hypothetical protein
LAWQDAHGRARHRRGVPKRRLIDLRAR